MGMQDLAFESWGEQGNRPILMLHGFMGCGADWAPLARPLAHTHFVLAPDLPGHGGSHFMVPDRFTMANSAESVIRLLDAQKIERCVCIGYSMGGRTALYLATRYPHRFDQLILESASPGLRTEAERAARRQWDAQIACRLEVETFSTFLHSWYQMGLFASFRAHQNFEHAFERRLRNDPSQLALSMRQMGTGSMPSLWEAWPQVRNASLIVGELDPKYVRISAEMRALNPHAASHIVKNAGHNVHFEQPAQFLSLLQSRLGHNPL